MMDKAKLDEIKAKIRESRAQPRPEHITEILTKVRDMREAKLARIKADSNVDQAEVAKQEDRVAKIKAHLDRKPKVSP